MSTTTDTSPRRRNRRGEGALLGREILQAAKDLLAETGDENAVSVRAVAQRVGVSTPSIYLHYEDKAALLEAVCTDVFEELDRAMVAAAAAVAEPFDSLAAMGEAYVRFAIDNPEHYRILLMSRNEYGTGQAGDDAVNTAAFQHLVEGVQRCVDAGVFGPALPAEQVAVSLWAAVHGIASLLIAKPRWPWPPLDEIVGNVIAMSGLGVVALTGGTPPPDDDCR